jgi:DNA-binding GntR family transcriptional regulator
MCEIIFGHSGKLRCRVAQCNLFAVDCRAPPAKHESGFVAKGWPVQKDAYTLILEAIDAGVYKPGDRLVESELAERFGVSRTPVREALQRLETQSMLSRDGRSLIVASLDHNQLAELYAVRTELEGLAARLAARHATEEEMRVLRSMVNDDLALLGGDPRALSRANRRFHKQIHLASHNRFLVQQLDLVHRSMALMATTSFAAEGRDTSGLAEHDAIVRAIEARDGEAAYQALRDHISKAFETRLRIDAGEVKTR